MRQQLLFSLAFASIIAFVCGGTAFAGIAPGYLEMREACPAASEVQDEQSRAEELDEDNQYALANKAAELYYDCSDQLTDPYLRDWAHLQSLTMRILSVQIGIALRAARFFRVFATVCKHWKP